MTVATPDAPWETPGTPVLALGSPVFPKTVVHLPSGATLTSTAPNAQLAAPYIHGLTVNGTAWNQAWLNYSALSTGATLNYSLSTTPDTVWASGANAAPPSDPTGEQAALTSAGPASGLVIAPGATGTATLTVTNLTTQAMTANWTATASSGITISPVRDQDRLGDVPAGHGGQRRRGQAGRAVAVLHLDRCLLRRPDHAVGLQRRRLAVLGQRAGHGGCDPGQHGHRGRDQLHLAERAGRPAYVYSVTGGLQSGKTVASVTLPSASGGYIGIFAIGAA